MNPDEMNNNNIEQDQANPVLNSTAPEAAKNTDATESADNVSEYRTFAIIGYILPFLFFLPLLNDDSKNVPYVRFHANQQLILLILAVGVYFLHSLILMTLMAIGLLLVQLLNLALLVLMVIGVINAYKGEMKELPLVGQFKILK